MQNPKILALVVAHVCVFAFMLSFTIQRWESTEFLTHFALAGLLIWISCNDFLSYRIPNVANLLLVFLGLFLTLLTQPSLFIEHLLSSVFWFAIFYAVIWFYRRFKGFDGLGLGDAKMMAGIGAVLGFVGPISVLFLASISGLIFGLILWFRNQNSTLGHTAIAFGPFLSVSTWYVWLFGPLI